MRQITVPQVRPVKANSPQETAMLFNQTMMELAPMHPTYEKDGDMFWIYYTVEYREAENICDEYELKGEGAKCVNCPHCVRDLNRFGDIDVRKKHATCTAKEGMRIRIDSSACEIYYKGKECR